MHRASAAMAFAELRAILVLFNCDHVVEVLVGKVKPSGYLDS